MSDTTDVPDDLVAAAMAGDREAVGRVLTIIRPLVVRYCRARLGAPDRSSAAADAHRASARNRSEPVADVPDSVEVADGPEQRALRVELSGEMGRLLDQLPDKQREILVLRVVVGLSAEETAEAVGSTPGAVRVAQHRALARLRKSMPEGSDLHA